MPTGTFFFEKKEHLYDIRLEYKHTSGDQRISLYWQSDGGKEGALACDFSQPGDFCVCHVREGERERFRFFFFVDPLSGGKM